MPDGDQEIILSSSLLLSLSILIYHVGNKYGWERRREDKRAGKKASNSPVWGCPCWALFLLLLESGEKNTRQLPQDCPRVAGSLSPLVCVKDTLLK